MNSIYSLCRLIDPASSDPADPADVRSLLEPAERHRLLPMLAHTLLSNREYARLAEEFRMELASYVLETKARVEKQLLAIETFGRAFDAAEVPWTLIGGFDIGRRFYPEFARASTDVDLLVAKRDFERATRVLQFVGAKRFIEGNPWVHQLSDALIDIHYEVTECGRIRAIRRAYRIDSAEVLASRGEYSYAGVRYFAPSKLMQELHLIAHAVKHGFECVMWAYDLHRLWTADGCDIDSLINAARRTNLLRGLYLTARWLLHFFPVSETCFEIVDRVPPAKLFPAEKRFLENLPEFPDRYLGTRLAFSWMPRTIDKLAFAFEILFPSEVLMNESTGGGYQNEPFRARWQRVKEVARHALDKNSG
ncbi:MAG: nucleotidyltransferase family protein [Planctomycetes bacterium]|nr:nucleotidyltransferase family protein [Planctomycetota bacterium]